MKSTLRFLLLLLPACTWAKDPDLSLCMLCHGTNANGNPAVRAPKLAGMEPWYLEAQLRAFRSGIRGLHALDVSGNEMRTIALALQAEEVTNVAATVAKLPTVAPTATVTGDPAKGRELFVPCAACHGDRAQGSATLRAPALAGGSDWYWLIQLQNFRDGLRGTDANDATGIQMRAAAATLPDDQALNDVVAYINSLSALE